MLCSTHLRIEVILSTVTRERSSAEPSRLRRQLRACLATNRPAGGWKSSDTILVALNIFLLMFLSLSIHEINKKIRERGRKHDITNLSPVSLPQSDTGGGLREQSQQEQHYLEPEVWNIKNSKTTTDQDKHI